VQDEPIDEIADYWDARYLSAGEAAWHILGFHVTKRSCCHIPSYPPGRIVFTPSVSMQKKDNTESTLSLLNQYFQCPIGLFTDASSGIQRDFSDLTYVEYFTLFRLTQFDI